MGVGSRHFPRSVEGTRRMGGRKVVDRLEAVGGREVPVAIAWVAEFGFLSQRGMRMERG